MRPYDVMLILEPTLEESAVQAVVNRSTELLQAGGGTVNRVDKWGRRRLAYEIGHRSEGSYVLLEVSAEPTALDELDRTLRLADDVIRHKIVRVPRHAGGRVRPPAVEEAAAAGPARTSRGEGSTDA
jgi:small subunit ribosomal protein S6